MTLRFALAAFGLLALVCLVIAAIANALAYVSVRIEDWALNEREPKP